MIYQIEVPVLNSGSEARLIIDQRCTIVKLDETNSACRIMSISSSKFFYVLCDRPPLSSDVYHISSVTYDKLRKALEQYIATKITLDDFLEL